MLYTFISFSERWPSSIPTKKSGFCTGFVVDEAGFFPKMPNIAWTGVHPSLEPEPETETGKGLVKAETHPCGAAKPPGGQRDEPGRNFSGSSSMASFFGYRGGPGLPAYPPL